ncbi:ABC transporter substrate-binding protein [Ornithinimicrobium murale]|uniref:ABC transporter substrate-binding protein n=1 Tax=Ornithinimicrobium murale TaxID=1050153 RepID=UPI000E0D06EF|nr:extracellular solute-binding protein [Ornithinimicrobium murale]
MADKFAVPGAGLTFDRRQVLQGLSALAGAGILGGLAGCGGDSSSTTGGSSDDGGGSSRLVVYATTVPPVQERLAAGFTAKTGIPVESLRLATGALAQRFMEEQRAGQHTADIITLGDPLVFRDLVAQDMLRDLTTVENYNAIPAEWDPQEKRILFSQSPETILYNTDAVAEDEVPTGWGDLLDSRFKGEILMADPRNNQTSQGRLFLMIHSAYGDEFFTELAKQEVRLTPNAPAATETVAAGGGSIAFPGLDMNLLPFVETKAPIATIPRAPSPTHMLYFYSGMVNSGPNPEAAEQWISYILSEEGQQLVNDGVGVSFYGPDKIKGSLPMPDTLVDPSPEEALESLPRFLELLNIGA